MMIENPWKCDDAAFGVMFCDEAEFTLSSNGQRGTIKCCVFPDEDTDPFAESDNESYVMSASMLVRKCDWKFLGSDRPQVGDGVKLPCGKKYKVQKIEAEQNWWRLIVRSVI